MVSIGLVVFFLYCDCLARVAAFCELFYILEKVRPSELVTDDGFQMIFPGVSGELGVVAFLDDACA
jgi:hypothetical protein